MAVLARDSVNFGFLSAHDPLLVHYAAQAEQYFATDPTAALIKLRRFAEILAQKAAATVGVYTDDIFWYRAAQELDSGVSLVWYMNGANPPVRETSRSTATTRLMSPTLTWTGVAISCGTRPIVRVARRLSGRA